MFGLLVYLNFLNCNASALPQPISTQKSHLQQQPSSSLVQSNNVKQHQSSFQQSSNIVVQKYQTPFRQQQQIETVAKVQNDRTQTRSPSDARIIYPTEESVILSNSSAKNYLITNNTLKDNTRNSKNFDSKNQTSTDVLVPNLVMPELNSNGKPRCLTESSFYCESVESYPK